MYLEPERNTQEKLKNKHNQNKTPNFQNFVSSKKFELIKNYISKI